MPTISEQEIVTVLEHIDDAKVCRRAQTADDMVITFCQDDCRFVVFFAQSPCHNTYESIMKLLINCYQDWLLMINKRLCEFDQLVLERSALSVALIQKCDMLILE